MKHKCLLLSIIAISSFTLFAQPVIRSQKTIGGNSSDVLTSLYLTNDGGIINAGYSFSNRSHEKTEDSRGKDDYWLIKLDSSGKIEWDKTIGGQGVDVLFLIQQTSDGGYFLGGYSSSNKSGEKLQSSRGSNDYWVVKLNASGKIEWDKTIGGSESDILPWIQQTKDDGYILGGWSHSNISAEKTQNSRGAEDFWMVKLNKAGNIEWDKTIGGSEGDGINCVEQTTDGGYILGGYSFSDISGEKTQNSRGAEDYWIVKLDKTGNIEWDKTIGGNDHDMLYVLQQTNDGGYILGGYSSSGISGEKTEKSRGKKDYWLVKVNDKGKVQWDKTFGGANNDILNALQQTDDGGYVIGGQSSSDKSSEKTENSRGDYDYWVLKLDNASNIEWDKTIGGNARDVLYSLKQINHNTYELGGFSVSGISGDKTEASRGGNDYWIVKLHYKQNGIPISFISPHKK